VARAGLKKLSDVKAITAARNYHQSILSIEFGLSVRERGREGWRGVGRERERESLN
jgi:hypothetical protein